MLAGALPHDLETVRVRAGACGRVPSSPTSISAYGGRTVQCSQRLAAPECLRALAIASWAIRMQLELHVARQPRALLVEGHVHRHGEVAATWWA